MSDFDKEAEREKLREKYERDREKREATEQMSELLLKGATMTNAHCGTCGDPIFRYDGQEFCPTCEEVVADERAEADEEADAADADAATTTEPDAETAVDSEPATDGPAADAAGATPDDAPSTDGTAARTNDVAGGETDTQSAGGTAPETGASRTEAAHGSVPERGTNHDAPSVDPDRTADAAAPVSTPPETDDAADTSLAGARASLARTVAQLARQAESSGDLERTRAYLAATEDAADALAAVKRADR